MNLDEIEARANAATPGPWYVHESDRPGDYWTVSADPSSPFYREVFDDGSGAGEYGEKCSIEDRDFLVAARTDVPALIARVRELEEAWDAAEAHGLHTDGTRELADALGIREGKMTADGVARHALQRVRELEAKQKTLAVHLQRLAPTWSHDTKSWTMREAEDGPYTLWSAAAETVCATMRERDEMRCRVRELEAERDEALADYQDLGRTMHEECTRLEAECERLKTFAAENFSAMIRQEVAQMREYGLSYEGVRKVLREHDDGEISFGKLMDLLRAAARAMAEDNQRAASNLLAIIHGDGGHYEGKHGTVKACKDAEGVVSDLRVKLDAATYALGLLYEETTDPCRCAAELCAGDYRHHISEPCRQAVRRALRKSATEGWEEPGGNVVTAGDLIGLRRKE